MFFSTGPAKWCVDKELGVCLEDCAGGWGGGGLWVGGGERLLNRGEVGGAGWPSGRQGLAGCKF